MLTKIRKWFKQHFYFSYTPKSWGIGVTVDLSNVSQKAYLGFYMIVDFELAVMFGPFSLVFFNAEPSAFELMERS